MRQAAMLQLFRAGLSDQLKWSGVALGVTLLKGSGRTIFGDSVAVAEITCATMVGTSVGATVGSRVFVAFGASVGKVVGSAGASGGTTTGSVASGLPVGAAVGSATTGTPEVGVGVIWTGA